MVEVEFALPWRCSVGEQQPALFRDHHQEQPVNQPQQRVMPVEGGQIDCVAMLGVLDELGYDGPVAVSQHSSHMKGQTRESIVGKASSLLDSLFAGAGIGNAALAEAK